MWLRDSSSANLPATAEDISRPYKLSPIAVKGAGAVADWARDPVAPTGFLDAYTNDGANTKKCNNTALATA